MKSLSAFAYLSLLVSSSLVNMAHAQQDSWKDPSYIYQSFNEIALKNEYSPNRNVVRKWIEPIVYKTIFYKMDSYPLVHELVDIHMLHLQDITEHDIRPSKANQAENLNIVFVQDKFYKQAINYFTKSSVKNIHKESNCMATINTNSQSEIQSATVIIPIDHAMSRGLLVSCIVEELTQVMGLPNDSDWVNPSIANDKSKHEFLTGLDYIMLKILYDKNIQAGESAKTLSYQLKKTINRLAQDSSIKRAHRLVNKTGLHPYSN